MPVLQRTIFCGEARLACAVAATALIGLSLSCSSPAKPTPVPPPPSPTITCPTALSLTSADGKAMTVTFTSPTASGGSPPVTVTCAPASGTSFPIGVTNVTCTAADAIARQATCGFSVTLVAPPSIQRTRFMAFGDSLTEGKVHLLIDYPESYTRRLQTLLQTRYTAQTPTVVNVGVGGEAATTGVTRLPGQLSAVRPEVVLLMDGANDLNSPEAASHLSPAAEAVRQMVKASQASGAVVFLANLPPQRFGGRSAAGAPYVATYNDRLRTIASSTGAHFVDVWSAFAGVASTDLVGPDGLHLTEAGYHKVADTFFEAIKSQLETKTGS